MKNDIDAFAAWLMGLGYQEAQKAMRGNLQAMLDSEQYEESNRAKGLIADKSIEQGVRAQDVLEAAIAKIAIDNAGPLVDMHEGLRLSQILREKMEDSQASRTGLQYEIEAMMDYTIPMLLQAGYSKKEIWQMAQQGWSKLRQASTAIRNSLKARTERVDEIMKQIENSSPDQVEDLMRAKEIASTPSDQERDFIASVISMVTDRTVTVNQMRENLSARNEPRGQTEQPTAYVIAGQFALIPLTNGKTHNLLSHTNQHFINWSDFDEMVEKMKEAKGG